MADGNIAIKVDRVNKVFKLPHEKHSSIKGVFLGRLRRRKSYEMQHAVQDVSFEIPEGEFFGIVGRNGSGKSTLLKIIAGVYAPTSGSVAINGSLVPFIELGVGFNPELSGRDNVFLNGALFGFGRQQMEDMYDDIVEFAELERFMDQKLKNYSSGMQVRLAFSIAIRARGDILVLDEVLAVGDTLFQQKCFNYFHELKKNGKTVLLVSHDTNALRQYCTSGVLMDNGKIISQGPIDKVLDDYTEILSTKEAAEMSSARQAGGQNRRGTGRMTIKSIATKDSRGKAKQLFNEADETITVEVGYASNEAVETPVYGLVIRDAAGNKIFTTNNLWAAEKSHDLKASQSQKIVWQLPNIFNTGEYFISPAVADFTGKETYDWVDDMTSLKVRKKMYSSAMVNPAHTIDIRKPGKS